MDSASSNIAPSALDPDLSSWLRSIDIPAWQEYATEFVIADLFCGCGGMTLGAVEAAIAYELRPVVAAAIDRDPEALGVYSANFATILNRVRNADLGSLFESRLDAPLSGSEQHLRRSTTEIDVLLAGPPCQGHSDLNNWTRRRDPRNALYLRAIRAVRVLEPNVAIIENVPTVIHSITGAPFRLERSTSKSWGTLFTISHSTRQLWAFHRSAKGTSSSPFTMTMSTCQLGLRKNEPAGKPPLSEMQLATWTMASRPSWQASLTRRLE